MTRDAVCRGCRFHRLRPAADAGLGATSRHRRSPDRSGHRRWPDRRIADRRCRAIARQRVAFDASSPLDAGPLVGRRCVCRRQIALGVCVLALPDPAPTLAHEVAANIADTDVGNPITAVLLAFRAMDTLLEAIVLLFALIGVWSLAADHSWGGRPRGATAGGPEWHPGVRGARAAAAGYHCRNLHLLGRSRRSRRQVPGRDHPGRDVVAGADGGACRCTADQPHLAASGAGRRAAGVYRYRPARAVYGGGLSRLPARIRQAVDRRH